jgi:molybdopterin synthase sulfur carrier subunit
MALKILMMGRLRDVAGWRERRLDAVPATLSALRDVLAGENAALAEALLGVGVQAAVNKTLARGDPALAEGDEIAFLPPMSGG